MTRDQVLARLRDIHMPEAVPFWPLAPGWWILIGLAAALVAAAAWVAWHRHTRLRREARRELDRLSVAFAETGDRVALAAGVSALLKRVALARFDPDRVAALHGESWTGFLNAAARRPVFTGDTGAAVARAAWAPREALGVDVDGPALLGAARTWIGRVA